MISDVRRRALEGFADAGQGGQLGAKVVRLRGTVFPAAAFVVLDQDLVSELYEEALVELNLQLRVGIP